MCLRQEKLETLFGVWTFLSVSGSCQTAFQNNCTKVYLHGQHLGVPVPFLPWSLALILDI